MMNRKKSSRSCVLGILLLWLVGPASAQLAVPRLTGRVVDQADILSQSTERAIADITAAHEDTTSNQVVVLTIPSLQGEILEAYSLQVAEAWGLGTAELDNGVLLLVSVNDREMRIEVGYGLEGTLPDVAASRIIRNDIAPHFREGNYDTGVLVGVQRILGVLEGSYYPSDTASDEMPPFWFGLIFLIVPSIFALFGMFTPGGIRWVLFFFLTPFYFAGGFVLTMSLMGALTIVGVYAVIYIASGFLPKVKAIQKKMKASGGGSSGWSSSSSSSWSSSSSSFSGGGGSFGGGGASGGW